MVLIQSENLVKNTSDSSPIPEKLMMPDYKAGKLMETERIGIKMYSSRTRGNLAPVKLKSYQPSDTLAQRSRSVVYARLRSSIEEKMQRRTMLWFIL